MVTNVVPVFVKSSEKTFAVMGEHDVDHDRLYPSTVVR